MFGTMAERKLVNVSSVTSSGDGRKKRPYILPG
jgi:hypothetical protein